MSHAGTIVGLSELEIEHVDQERGIEVRARPLNRPSCKHSTAPARAQFSTTEKSSEVR